MVQITADLSFRVDVPAGRSGPVLCTGRVSADGSDVTVEFNPMPSLGGSSTRPLVRPLADQLNSLGLTVHILGPGGPLLRMGAGVRAPWWQRAATRGSRIELVSVNGLARSVGGPKLFQVALPPAAVFPAVTSSQRSRPRRIAVAARQALRRLTGSRR